MGIEMWEGFLFVKDVDLSPFVLGSSSNFVGWGYYVGHPPKCQSCAMIR